MKLRFRYTNRIVGIFATTAIIIVMISIYFVLQNNRAFDKTYSFVVQFSDGDGLGSSNPVYFKGFKIGTISEIKLTDENLIEGVFEVYEEYRNRIVKNSVIFKSYNPVTSASTLQFLKGKDEKKLIQEGGRIPSLDMPEGKQLLAENKIEKSGDPLSSILLNLQTFTENLNLDNNADKGAVFRALVNLAEASEKANSLANQLSEFGDNLFADNNPDKGAIFRALNNLADISQQLKTTVSLLNKTLAQSDTLLAAYSKPEGLVKRMIDPEGKEIYEPITQTVAQLNALVPQLDNFVSYLNSQSTDLTIIFDELKMMLRQVQITFEKINSSPLMGGGESMERKVNPTADQLRPKNFEK